MAAWEPPMMREEGGRQLVAAFVSVSVSLCVRMHGRTRIWISISRGERRISRRPVGRSADFLRCLCGQTDNGGEKAGSGRTGVLCFE